MISVFPFTSKDLIHLDQVGSKALSLINMTRNGLPVPPGFVLTVDFFKSWMTVLQQTPEWKAIQKANNEFGQSTKALRNRCTDLQFSIEQREKFAAALQNLQLTCPGSFFAVRSSSPEEDLEGASFAGGYETTLGVTLEKMESAGQLLGE